mmetsp:Transcript_103279/g.297401  ORF Transcript_103279/g.297401 Transcript_103279/m.297401 type:complete len:529 (-) Transcript_103279:134-1720(-)
MMTTPPNSRRRHRPLHKRSEKQAPGIKHSDQISRAVRGFARRWMAAAGKSSPCPQGGRALIRQPVELRQGYPRQRRGDASGAGDGRRHGGGDGRSDEDRRNLPRNEAQEGLAPKDEIANALLGCAQHCAEHVLRRLLVLGLRHHLDQRRRQAVAAVAHDSLAVADQRDDLDDVGVLPESGMEPLHEGRHADGNAVVRRHHPARLIVQRGIRRHQSNQVAHRATHQRSQVNIDQVQAVDDRVHDTDGTAAHACVDLQNPGARGLGIAHVQVQHAAGEAQGGHGGDAVGGDHCLDHGAQARRVAAARALEIGAAGLLRRVHDGAEHHRARLHHDLHADLRAVDVLLQNQDLVLRRLAAPCLPLEELVHRLRLGCNFDDAAGARALGRLQDRGKPHLRHGAHAEGEPILKPGGDQTLAGLVLIDAAPDGVVRVRGHAQALGHQARQQQVLVVCVVDRVRRWGAGRRQRLHDRIREARVLRPRGHARDLHELADQARGQHLRGPRVAVVDQDDLQPHRVQLLEHLNAPRPDP